MSSQSAESPETYEAWYESPRGRWISATEYSLLCSLLQPAPGASMLDIGCGTGHFTRLFAADYGGTMVGLDPDRGAIAYAAQRAHSGEHYVIGRAEALPFPDSSFDFTVSVAALGFIEDQRQALRELIRVTRKRFVLGLVNRHSLLYLKEGWNARTAGYQGLHWHSREEVESLLRSVGIDRFAMRSAIVLPGGTAPARAIEAWWPQQILLGGFLVVAGALPSVANPD